MVEDSAIVDRLGQAQALAASGDRDGARALYKTWWSEATRAEDPYQACVAAHFMAHEHDEPEVQLDWHLRALGAADDVDDERVHVFYPSLYANVGEVYLRLGNLPQAREHIDKARAHEHLLRDDGYGRIIRSLITRVTQAVGGDNAR